jgi:hypothetical protein
MVAQPALPPGDNGTDFQRVSRYETGKITPSLDEFPGDDLASLPHMLDALLAKTASRPSPTASARSWRPPGQSFPHVHKGEAEKVQPFPLRRPADPAVVGSQADAPDPVRRASLHKNASRRGCQICQQVGVLPEFGDIPLDHDGVAACRPPL